MTPEERNWLHNIYLALFFGGSDTPEGKSLLALVDSARQNNPDAVVIAQQLVALGLGEQVASELVKKLSND